MEHEQIVCLQLIRLKTVEHRPLVESACIIHCYTTDRLAIQWPAQQPFQATTTLKDMHYKHVAL